jgi:hypothetical protein
MIIITQANVYYESKMFDDAISEFTLALTMKEQIFGKEDEAETGRTRKALKKAIKRKKYEEKKTIEIAEVRAAKKAAKKLAISASNIASDAAKAAKLSVEQSEAVSSPTKNV